MANEDNTQPTGLCVRCSEESARLIKIYRAMDGNITAGMQAVSVTRTGNRITLHFVIDRDRPVEREAIDDIELDFQALHGRFVDVDVIITVDSRPLRELNLPGRVVYMRRE